jgi:hypothetical protein
MKANISRLNFATIPAAKINQTAELSVALNASLNG